MYTQPFAQPPQQVQSLTQQQQQQQQQQHREDLAWLSRQSSLDNSPLQPSALLPSHPTHTQQQHGHHHHQQQQQPQLIEQFVELQSNHPFLQGQGHPHHADPLPPSYRPENSLAPIPRHPSQSFPSSLDPSSPLSPVSYNSNSALSHSPQSQVQLQQQQPQQTTPTFHHQATTGTTGGPLEIPSHGPLAPLSWGMVDYGGKDLFVAPEEISMQPVVDGFVNPLHLFTSPPRPLSGLSSPTPPSAAASVSHRYHQQDGGDDSESFTGTDDDEVRLQLAADPSYQSSTPPLSPHSPGAVIGHHPHHHHSPDHASHHYYSHHHQQQHHHHHHHASQQQQAHHHQGLIQSLANMTTTSPRSNPESPFRMRVGGGSMSGHHDGGLVQTLANNADPYSRGAYNDGQQQHSYGHPHHHPLHPLGGLPTTGGNNMVPLDPNEENNAEEEERLFKCDQCQKRFLRQYNLNAHLKTHSLERNHPCDQCSKSFLRPYDLSRHQRIHTKDKPYTCKICGLIFIRNDAIWRHYRKAHQGHPDVPTSRREKSLSNKAGFSSSSSSSSLAARQIMSTSPPPSFE